MQTLGRYADSLASLTSQAWYYLQVILTALAAADAAAAVARARAGARRCARAMHACCCRWRSSCSTSASSRLSSGKRDVYILSALPPLALAAGHLLPGLLERRGVQRTLLGFLVVLALALGGGWLQLTWLKPAQGAKLLAEGGVASTTPLLVLALAAVVSIAVFRLRRAGLATLAFFTLAWLVISLWIFPQMDAQRSASAFIARVEATADAERPLALVEYRENFLWNLRRDTFNFGHRRFREGAQEVHDAAAWLARDPGRQLLVSTPSRDLCFDSAQALPVGESGSLEWWVVSGTPAADCVGKGDAGRAILYQPLMPETLL